MQIPDDMVLEVAGVRYDVHWHRWEDVTVCVIRRNGKPAGGERYAIDGAIRNPQDCENAERGVREAAKNACLLAGWRWGTQNKLGELFYSEIRKRLWTKTKEELKPPTIVTVSDPRWSDCLPKPNHHWDKFRAAKEEEFTRP